MSPGRRDDREFRRALERSVAPRRRTSLPLLLWNWWRELLILAGLVILGLAVGDTFGLPGVIAGLSALTGAVALPWSEQFRAWVWQLVTPHLLRSGLYHAGIENRNGRIPLIVRVTREPFGERVRMRCPAGICAEDVDYARDILRAACWAADVRVMRDDLRAHMVTVDVVRHPDKRGDLDDGYPYLIGGRQ